MTQIACVNQNHITVNFYYIWLAINASFFKWGHAECGSWLLVWWWTSIKSYLKLCFNNKGNTQNNSQSWTFFPPLRVARMTVQHKQDTRLKLYCSWQIVETFFLVSLPQASWRLKLSFRKGPSSSAVLICLEESRHCPCKKGFSHLETNVWSPANISTLSGPLNIYEPVQRCGDPPTEHSTGDQLAETHQQAQV